MYRYRKRVAECVSIVGAMQAITLRGSPFECEDDTYTVLDRIGIQSAVEAYDKW